MFTLIAGLVLGSAIAPDHPPVALQHRGRAVTATYRPAVRVAHRQIGSTAPGGRAATLRCVWTASIAVERHARRDDGLTVVRHLAADSVTGSRPGWCSKTVRVDTARIDAHVRQQVAAAAAADDTSLLADLDAAHDRVAG